MKRLLFLVAALATLSGVQAQLPTPISIAAVRNAVDSTSNSNDISTLDGTDVQVCGVVMTNPEDWYQATIPAPASDNSGGDRIGFWLVDSATSPGQTFGLKSGILVDQDKESAADRTATGIDQIQVGNYVCVFGSVDYFGGNIQLSLDPADNHAISIVQNSAPIPAARPVQASDFLDASGQKLSTAFPLEGVYVEMVGPLAVTGGRSTGTPRPIVELDDNGIELVMFGIFRNMVQGTFPGELDPLPANGPPVPVGTVYDTIRGFIYDFDDGGYYEICPFRDEDVVVGIPVPLIEEVDRTPVCPAPGVAVNIDATISQLGSNPLNDADSVVLKWTTGLAPTQADYDGNVIQMTFNSTDNVWEATIPASEVVAGVTLSYYVEAWELDFDTPVSANGPSWGYPYAFTPNANGCQIVDIQTSPDFRFGGAFTWNSGYQEQRVTDVSGIITAVFNQNGTNPVLIMQDPSATAWGGIGLITDNPAAFNGVEIGDSVTVSGEVAEPGREIVTCIDVTTLTNNGAPTSTVQAVTPFETSDFGGNDFWEYTMEPYEAMLVRFNESGLSVVDTATDPFATYRVGTDALDPNTGVRTKAGRFEYVNEWRDYSSEFVSVVNDRGVDDLDPSITPCLVLNNDDTTTTMDSLQGIFVQSFGDPTLYPRTNADFWNVEGCRGGPVSTPESFQAAHLKLYPNPTTGTLHIDFPELGTYSIQVVDLMGRTHHVVSTTGASATLNLEGHPSGTYFLVVTGENGSRFSSTVLLTR